MASSFTRLFPAARCRGALKAKPTLPHEPAASSRRDRPAVSISARGSPHELRSTARWPPLGRLETALGPVVRHFGRFERLRLAPSSLSSPLICSSTSFSGFHVCERHPRSHRTAPSRLPRAPRRPGSAKSGDSRVGRAAKERQRYEIPL